MMNEMMGVGWVWLLIALLGLALLIYVTVRLARGGTSDSTPGSRAREILDERFARGEIDEDEYQRRRNELR